MRIGERIKIYREVKNMSQQDLSSAAGVSLGLIQQIEQGRHNNPSVNVLEKISNVLDIDIIHLLRDPVDIRVPGDKIESLKKRMNLVYIPLFEEIPTEADIQMKNLSKVKALVPIANNRAEYIFQITKEYNICGAIRKNDYIGVRRVKNIKDSCTYIFQTKDKGYHIGLCKIYNGGKAYFRSHDLNEEPIEFNKTVRVLGEVVLWLKSSLNDSLPLPKISL